MHARHPALYAAARPPLFPCGPCGHDSGAYSQNVPVQRPLARRRVLLSHPLIATMASSAPLVPLAALWIMATSSRPTVCSGLGPRGSPFSSVYLFPSCHLPYPDGWNGSHWLSSPFPLAFTVFALVRHPYRHHRRFSGGQRHEAAKFALCYGPKRLLALPRQGRLRSSFHLPSRLQETSNIATRQTSNSRDRTFTGKIDSPMGCKQRREARKETQSCSCAPRVSASSAHRDHHVQNRPEIKDVTFA